MQVWDKKWTESQKQMLNVLENDFNLGDYNKLYKDACNMVKTFNLRYSCIKDYSQKYIIKNIKALINAQPKALADLTKDKLLEIKKFTIITRLLGYGYRINIPYIPKDYSTGIKYDYPVCQRILRDYIWNQEKLQEISPHDVVLVTVSPGCHDNPCDFYNKLYKKKTFEPEDAPEVPFAQCEKETGCHCSLCVKYL